MRFTRWWNPSLPQTLLYSVMLLYIDAAMGLLSLLGSRLGGSAYAWIGVALGADGRSTGGLLVLSVLIATAAYTFAGLGIANGQQLGWRVGVGVAVGAVALPVIAFLRGFDLGGTYIVTLLFNIGLVVLLVHPQSREYQRIWFEGSSGRSGGRRRR